MRRWEVEVDAVNRGRIAVIGVGLVWLVVAGCGLDSSLTCGTSCPGDATVDAASDGPSADGSDGGAPKDGATNDVTTTTDGGDAGCKGDGGSCLTNGECCSNICIAEGRCTNSCAALNTSCTLQNDNCCSDGFCNPDSGQCAACKTSGQTCGDDNWCCSRKCFGNTCN
jgi:hypothetical protein